MHKSPQQIICSIPLSNSSVQRRINEMFGLGTDESTLPDNQALLLGYVRCIDYKKISQKLIFSTNHETYTKGSSIYNVVEICFNENNILLTNIYCVLQMVHHQW